MGSYYQMIKYVAFTFLLSLTALADNDVNAVNERIPVTPAELEAHWQVDCTAAWSQLQAAAAQQPTSGHCGISATLQHHIKLCAYIYQPPGPKPNHHCPDYAQISRRLEHAGDVAVDCPDLTASIANQETCDRGAPGLHSRSGTSSHPVP